MRRTAVIGIVALLAVVVVGLVVSSLRGRGPRYQGKSVDFWLRQVFGGRQREAMEAFREMGPEALPQLVKALKRNDSSFDRFYQGVYPRLPDVAKGFLVQPVSVSADEIRSAASLVLLNSEHARLVLPQLAGLRISAVNSLARYGPVASNAVETLLQIFPTSSGEVRKAVGIALQQIDPAAAAKVGAK